MKVDQFSKKNNILNLFFLSANKKKVRRRRVAHKYYTHSHTPMKLTTIKRNDYEKTLLKRKANIIETN